MGKNVITQEQLLEKLVENAHTGDERDGTKDQLRKWILDRDILDESVVIMTLEDLDVEDVEERIEWYNQATLGLKDVLYLCNMEFYLLQADCCTKVQYLGDPYQQGTYSKNELINASGSINGQTVDVYLCQEHWPKWLT